MKLRQIAVDQIKVPPVRVTAVYDEEQLQLLRDSLNAMGTVQPIVVVAVDGAFEVVDGLHRWQEAKTRGDTHIPAVVYEGTPADSLLMNLVLNRVRGKIKASEMVEVIKTLWKDHHMDSDQIAAKTGLSRDYIERLQCITTVSEPVRQALEQERIGVGVAYEISRLPNPLQQEQVLNQELVYGIPTKEMHKIVSNVLAQMEVLTHPPLPTQPVEPPSPPVFVCDCCREEIAPLYLKPVQICPTCFGQLWRVAKGLPPTDAPDG